MATKKTQQPEAQKVVVFARTPHSSWARVLYGTLVDADLEKGLATLTGVRQCIFYSKETGGEAGLAAIDPQPGSRVSPVAEGRMCIAGVSLIANCSATAISTWEAFK